MLKKLVWTFASAFVIALAFAGITMANELDIDVSSSDGYGCDVLLDDDFNTTDYYRTDTVLTVSADEAIEALYIKWDTLPGEWKLTAGGNEITCGQNGFLHEFIKLPKSADSLEIKITTDRTYIADIYAFSGNIPDWVQIWEPSYDKADILYFSTHSDDDVLFFGGLIPTYVNGGKNRVQAAYMVDHSKPNDPYGNEPYRNHELLDCTWEMGLDHYPQMGIFGDFYAESVEEAEVDTSLGEVTEYVTEVIRKFKPQVLISQDFDGEYGHGQHMLLAAAIEKAIEITGDASQYPDSAGKYGAWDVPKTYYHLYGEKKIEIDDRIPLDDFAGRTALQVAKDAYKCHQSQQWMWYYVSDGMDEDGNPDGYEYPCNAFGLFRTLVGDDTGNDVMENITPYDQQSEVPVETTAAVTDETEASTGEETTTAPAEEPDTEGKKTTDLSKIILIILCIVGGLFVIFVIIILLIYFKGKKEAEKRRALERKYSQRRRR